MPTDYVTNPRVEPLNLRVVDWHGNVSFDGTIGSALTSGYERSRTWVRTPGFHSGFRNKATRRFDLPMNPFSFVIRKTQYPYGTLRLSSVGENLPNGKVGLTTSTYEGALFGVPTYVGGTYPDLAPASLPAIDLNYLNERAVTRLLLESKDQKANLAQTFAERGQTARLLVSTIKRVDSAIKSLKKGNLAGAASALGIKVSASRQRRYSKSWKEDQAKAIANTWLELQYGWIPLLKDVVGAAELLAQHVIREVRTRVVKSASQTMWVDGIAPSGAAPFKLSRKVRRKVTVKYVAYWSTSPVNHSLAQVGITNPLLIAWELLPWSFVYDWFVPIGNYISTLDSTFGLAFEKGCKTVYEQIIVTGHTLSGRVPYTGQGTGTLLSVDVSGAEYRDEVVNITRTTLNEWPSSVPPSFKNPFSALHVANALALLYKTVRLR